MTLRNALVQYSAGWRDDLPAAWRTVLRHVEPAAVDVRSSLTFGPEPIFPARRARQLAEAREDAHVFRAFDGLDPADVRCVLVGQDPYPRIARATGRSFEQGDLDSWPTTLSQTALSLRTLVQKLAQARTGTADYIRPGGWSKIIAGAHSGELRLDKPRTLFDHWQENGVLCLNAGLTLTRYKNGGAPEQVFGHIPFWSPVIGAVLRHLASRPGTPVVYLLLGTYAHKLAQSVGVRETAEANGRWGTFVDEVRLPHPAATHFLAGPNPFNQVNEKLEAMGAPPVHW